MDASIVLCGPAGQGVQTAEQLLVAIFRQAGLNVFATKEYMSRVRGGSNSTTIRISPDCVRALVGRMDIFVLWRRGALTWARWRSPSGMSPGGEPEMLFDPRPGRYTSRPADAAM
ncbi:MAG: 2-oxoacid:acceptor oxidoreductase family protein [Thermoleophilia bacterium]|nr:2-oxoacid:acceptor oxidoreductase family protein [Thermoleophilia bacterium]